jgi:hypothetical protein
MLFEENSDLVSELTLQPVVIQNKTEWFRNK